MRQSSGGPGLASMTKQQLLLISTAAAISLIGGGFAAQDQTVDPIQTQIDWPAFIARHDMVWDSLPNHFDYGAFLGNGMLGATIYQEGDNRLRFEMGRSDVTEHRRDNCRLPIGGLVLTTVGKIQSGTLRVDLWNAEVRGTVITDKGTIDFRSFIHTENMVLMIDVKTVDAEAAAAFAWNPAKCTDRGREVVLKDPPHPEPRNATEGGVSVCIPGPFFRRGVRNRLWGEGSPRNASSLSEHRRVGHQVDPPLAEDG
jgi:hypothetical protein